ncbi:nucleotide sugar dehydrogenase [Streptomyces sp. NPDC050085]|uniref:nucleotide sugar dehydrogenase n=1 Tax=Streptomyces sp. NPDC050085 TaxID=3365600 RepID=UPI0037A0B6FA
MGASQLFTHADSLHADAPHADAPVVGIIGLGYVGLPTALALLESGVRVIGLDADERRLAAIRAYDVDLLAADHARLRRHVPGERFLLTSDPARLRAAETVVICVPTPVDDHLVPDLRALEGACATAVEQAVPGQALVLTSTSYVGTTRDLLLRPLAARGLTVPQDVSVAYAPERIDPGNAAHTQDSTPRVIGGVSPECTRRAADVLRRTGARVHEVLSPEAAEMTKLLENTFRAVNIALANEFATICGELGLEAIEVIEAAATKPYGFMAFFPGPGVGGHCIPCDPHYLLWQLRERRVASPLIDAAMTAIATRPHQVVRRAREVLADGGTALRGARILVVGVAYKPGVADVRESPSIEILGELAEAGAEVAFSDPLVAELAVSTQLLRAEQNPGELTWDLIVIHSVHPLLDLSWVPDRVPVLDTTYRLQDFKRRAVV